MQDFLFIQLVTSVHLIAYTCTASRYTNVMYDYTAFPFLSPIMDDQTGLLCWHFMLCSQLGAHHLLFVHVDKMVASLLPPFFFPFGTSSPCTTTNISSFSLHPCVPTPFFNILVGLSSFVDNIFLWLYVGYGNPLHLCWWTALPA